MSGEKVAKFLEAYKIINNNEVPEVERKKSLIETGIQKEGVAFLLKMKHGTSTCCKFFFDGEDNPESVITLRLLSAQEEADIGDEMMKLPYIKGVHYQYFIYYYSKILEAAFKKTTSHMPTNQPEFTEVELRESLPEYVLTAIGSRYVEFVHKVSPRIEMLTDQDLDNILAELAECESIEKKYDTLNGWRLKLTQEVLLRCLSKLEDVTKQMDRFVIGS